MLQTAFPNANESRVPAPAFGLPSSETGNAEPARCPLEPPHVAPIEPHTEPTEIRGPALFWIERETAIVSDGGDLRWRAEAGDVVTVPSGSAVRIQADRPGATLLAFESDELWALEVRHLAGLPPSREGECPYLHRAGSDVARRGARLLRDLANSPDASAPGCDLERTARRVELLALIRPGPGGFIEARAREPRRARERRSQLLRVLDELGQGPLDSVNLASVALQLGTSERQTSRLFRTELATTFRQYMSELRLRRAKELLRTTDRPVIEVAAETGWRSLGHFTSTFRRRVGLTPSAYREIGNRDEGGEEGGRAA